MFSKALDRRDIAVSLELCCVSFVPMDVFGGADDMNFLTLANSSMECLLPWAKRLWFDGSKSGRASAKLLLSLLFFCVDELDEVDDELADELSEELEVELIDSLSFGEDVFLEKKLGIH